MYHDAEYFVLQCDRCRLTQPYEQKRCSRCGALETRVARVGRAEVMEVALQFLVPTQAVAMPRELAMSLQARPVVHATAPVRPVQWALALGERVVGAVSALRARPVAAMAAQPRPADPER